MRSEKNAVLEPSKEVCLCSGAIAQVLYNCRKERFTQPEIGNALLGCFFPNATYNDDFINKIFKCTSEVPTDVSASIKNNNPSDFVRRFEQKMKPLLKENMVNNIIMSLCHIVEHDDSIFPQTIINEIEGTKKSGLRTASHFNVSEFVIGLFIYAVQNVKNSRGKQCISTITKDYIEVFSPNHTKPWFTWGWTLLSGERGAVIAFSQKSEALTGLLNILQTENVDFFCVFGGVASTLIKDSTCNLFSKWLIDNPAAHLYMCYETGKAAEGRARLLNPLRIPEDGLP